MIKSYDGQRVHNAMIDELVRQEIARQNVARIAELEAEVKRLEGEMELRKLHDERLYTRCIADAERDYPEPERETLLGKIGWALLGWVVLGFATLFDGLGM